MSEHKRKAFFDICMEAFQSLTGDTRELYICPLCGKGFTRRDLKERVLTLEHVPPKSLGGKELLLTCKRCNNTAGHRVDSALHARQSLHDLIEALRHGSARYQGRVKLEIGSEKLNFDLLAKGEDGQIELTPAGNNPTAMTRWESQMKRYVDENTWNGQQFNITPVHNRFHQWLSKVGDLRIAYLLAFAAFGYRYAFNKRLDPIRDQLDNPEERKLDWFWTFSGWRPQQKRVLAIATKPVELLFICLGSSIVLLPWLDGPLDPYKELASKCRKDQRIAFSGKEVPWPDRLRLELDFIAKKKQSSN